MEGRMELQPYLKIQKQLFLLFQVFQIFIEPLEDYMLQKKGKHGK